MDDVDKRYICQRCGVDWTGAPGHPKDYCDTMKIRMDHSEALEEIDRLKLQNEELRKDKQALIDERGRLAANAEMIARWSDEKEGKLQGQEKLIERMTNSLNKIHDLAGQISGPDAHPNLGAIQDWVHQVLPCEETLVGPVQNCIDCGKPVTSGNICIPCVKVRYPSKEERQ